MNSNTTSSATVGFASAPVRALASIGQLKRVLMAAAITWAVASADAQTGGTVNFGNHSSSLVTNGQTSLPVSTSDNVQAALYWAPLGSNSFVQLGAAVPVGTPLAGVFVGGTRTTGTETPGGSSGLFQVLAWSGGYDTYEQALTNAGVLIGQSAVFTNQTGNPSGNPPSAPVSLLAGGFSGFTLTNNSGSVAPPASTINTSSWFRGAGFQLAFTNTPGEPLTVLVATNLALPLTNWTPLTGVTEVSPGQFQFTDPQATNLPCRYYRLRWP